MKKLIIVVFVIFLAFPVFSQNNQAVSTKMDGTRFEVIQNPQVRRYTFFLDKYEGKVYQLAKTSTDGVTWEEMEVYPRDTQEYTTQTYQIYISGLVAADTYLINTKPGRTWVLVQKHDKSVYWEEFY